MKAEALATILGGRKIGRGFIARCPSHPDRKPSLSICDGPNGKVLVHCFAGCDQQRVIAELKARGLWEAHVNRKIPSPPLRPLEHRPDGIDMGRTKSALAIWHSSRAAAGTLVEIYLASRALNLPPPAALRFHAGLRHPLGGIWPAIVALVTRGFDSVPLAVHRTFLARDGAGKVPVEPAKMMLGPCHGGAVRLGDPLDVLMVGEGIETCLAAMQATGNPTWAALSTSGLCALELPDEVREVIVLADGDDAGEAAAQDCAWRWHQEGRRVRIARPPQGMDFNDLLRGSSPDIMGDSK